MGFAWQQNIGRRFYAHADVEGAGGGTRTRTKDLLRFNTGGSGSSASKSVRQVGAYNADSLLSLGKGPISRDTADKLVESGAASARTENGQVYLTPSQPKTTAPTYSAPTSSVPKFEAPRAQMGIPSFASTGSGGRGGSSYSRQRSMISRTGQGALSEITRRASNWTGKLGTVMDVQKGTAMRSVYENQAKTLEDQIGALDAILRDPYSTDRDRREAEEARNIAQRELNNYNRAITANRGTAQKLYETTDAGLRVSEDMARRSVEGTTGLKRAFLSHVPDATGAVIDAGLNRFLPGLDYLSSIVDTAGQKETNYRHESGANYDPYTAASQGMKSAAGFIGTNLALQSVGNLLQKISLSPQQKNAIQGDLSDIQSQYDDFLQTLSDPHATTEQRIRAAQRTIDAADFARGRIDDLALPASQREAGKAQDALADIAEQLKPYTIVGEVPTARLGLPAHEGVHQSESDFLSWAKSIGISDTVKTIEEYDFIKYNDPARFQLLTQYAEDVEAGWISPLSTFENYESLYNRVQNEIVGQTTMNGITITGQVPHFMQRVVGTGVDPKKLQEDLQVIRRSGVEFDDIKNTLLSPIKTGPITIKENGNRSIVFFGEQCTVSINPDTGKLIQVNPRRRS